ncbi:MAG: glycosyltransferase [Solirubrobacteraceae bacterium]
MPSQPTASIVIPTRRRPGYLSIALQSIIPQAQALGAEVVVVNDGDDPETAQVARGHGAAVIALPAPGGANAGRNAGIDAAAADLIVLTDDDVLAPDGWLEAILQGAASAPHAGVLGGPIRAALEGGGPRACGHEDPPITTLDLGGDDCDVELVWSANMALRREALALAGRFDERLHGRGEEEEWERRFTAAGGTVRYLARAGLHHRRSTADATVARLSRAAYALGASARAYDERKGTAPSLAGELRTLAGCAWHTVRRRCALGVVMAAHTAGRLREALAAPRPDSVADGDFASGEHGTVVGIRATARALAADALADTAAIATAQAPRLQRAARRMQRRSVLALSIESTGPNLLRAARSELLGSRHAVTFDSAPAGELGKFQNLNALLARHRPAEHDWLLVIDDDVVLPRGFLDRFLFLAERFELALAQPAHRGRSHAAWEVTRRRPASLVRETCWVEIGPVVAFARATFDVLLPFPELRMGWGLDAHWGAIARERGWRLGVVDATAIAHGIRRIASGYTHADALAESRLFLRDRPHVTPAEAQRTLVTHRSLG